MGNNQERKEFLQDDGQLRVFIVPTDIMDVPGLTIYEQMTYMVLRSYVNPTDPTAFPSYKTIAQRGRMSRSSAIRSVEGLVEKGLITKEVRLDVSKNRKIKNTSNLYTIKTPRKKGSVSQTPPGGSSSQTPGGSVSQTPGVVPDRYQGGVSQIPYHYHLKEPSLNMIDCTKTDTNEIYELLKDKASKYCYYEGIPLGVGHINEIYLMLLKQFSGQLSAEIVHIACELYFDRACELSIPEGVVMTQDISNPVGFFHHCYKDAIEQYKATKK